MRVTIFGSGYVGLVTGACLADAGNHVICVDVDAAKVARLKVRLYEVPISYHGRDYAQGKKIGFRDAVRAAWCIVRYRVAD